MQAVSGRIVTGHTRVDQNAVSAAEATRCLRHEDEESIQPLGSSALDPIGELSELLASILEPG